MNKKTGFYTLAIAVVISVAVVMTVISPNVTRQTVLNAEKSVITDTGEIFDKPTFMYFVTNKEKKQVAKTIKTLEDEFGDRVIFEIKNISSDKGLTKKFPVKDNTPALIMELPNGDVSEILLNTTDIQRLRLAIEESLQKGN